MSTMPGSAPDVTGGKAALASTEIRRFLEDFVRRRVQGTEAEDVVQTVLVDALAAERIPEGREELRKWLVGIARHKVADHHRKATRERPEDPPEPEASPAPLEAREMVRWAEKQAEGKDAQKTLDWMAREGEGEKLENIAAEEDIPAARVRQRVSRMRRWMKEKWLAELAAVAVLGLLALLLYKIFRSPDELPEALPEPPNKSVQPDTLDRARQLRAEALERCRKDDHRGCIDGLDAAKRLDPSGDTQPEIAGARRRAEDALSAPPPEKPIAPLPPDSKGPPTKATPLDEKEQKEQKEKATPQKPVAPKTENVKPTKPQLDKKLDFKGSIDSSGEPPSPPPSQQLTPPPASTSIDSFPSQAPAKKSAPIFGKGKGGK